MRRRDVLRGSAAVGAGAAGMAAAEQAAAADRPPEQPLRVQIVMFDGAEEQDFVGPYEVFALAGAVSLGGVETSYVRVDGPGMIRASHGTVVEVAGAWAPRQADLIVVPGGGYGRRDGPGIWPEIERGTLPKALAEARRPGLILASVCTGALILGAAGLVRGRPCVTHHGAVTDLEAQGGVLKDARVVDDGDLVTAGGITSGLDLGLWLVNREVGADTAVTVENVLEYQARGVVWTR